MVGIKFMPRGVFKRKPFTDKHLKNLSIAHKGQVSWLKGTKGLIVGKKGEESHGWKGDSIIYSGIHLWLIKTFGKATRCENLLCEKKSKNFDWALIHGNDYKRLREVFMMLCRSCHVRYDRHIRKIVR